MRVLHVIPSVGPLRGGPSFAALEMVRAQRALGLDSRIAATDDNGPGSMEVRTDDWTVYQGVPVRFFPRWSPPFHPVREFQFNAAFVPWFRNALGDWDVIHAHAFFSWLSSAAMRTCRRAGKPYLARPLGQFCSWSMRKRPWKKRAFWYLVDRANANSAAAIHYTSQEEADDSAHMRVRAPALVAPHGVEPIDPPPDARARLRESLGLPQNSEVILFLSRLASKKGLDLLLPAFARLHRPDCHLILAGSGDPAFVASLKDFASTLGIGGRVHFPGFVAGEQRSLFFGGADVFALPSRNENFGIAVLEALSAGTPVVISEGVAFAHRFAADRIAALCDMTPDSIAAAIGATLDDPQRAAHGARAMALVRREFTWEANARALAAAYGSVRLGRAPTCQEKANV